MKRINNNELKHASELLSANKLSSSVGKLSLTLFRKTKVTFKPDIKIVGEQIKEKGYAKYLGILIDITFSCTYCINHVNLRISWGKAIVTVA